MPPAIRPPPLRWPVDPRRRSAWAVGTWIACAAAAAPAMAGPWEATTAQGLTVRIDHDPARARDAYVLERRYPDGTADAGFGQHGSVLFQLGPDHEGPAALRLDALGRPWIAGASAGRGDTLEAVVLRFAAHGLPDPSFGRGGRSATAPAGRPARALDLSPQPDGSALVVGMVIVDGQERSGWWRLTPDGRVDPRFGLGGVWTDPGGGSTEPVSLDTAADGSVALGLRRGDGTATRLEAWVLAPGATLPVHDTTSADPAARLAWRDGRWQWQGAGPPSAAVPSSSGRLPPAAAASAASGAPAPPGPHRAPAPTAPALATSTPPTHEVASPGLPGGAVAGACAAAAIIALGLWRRHATRRRRQ